MLFHYTVSREGKEQLVKIVRKTKENENFLKVCIPQLYAKINECIMSTTTYQQL